MAKVKQENAFQSSVFSSVALQAFVTKQEREILQEKEAKYLSRLHKREEYYECFVSHFKLNQDCIPSPEE